MSMSLSPKNFALMLLALLICLYIHKNLMRNNKSLAPDAVKAGIAQVWTRVLDLTN